MSFNMQTSYLPRRLLMRNETIVSNNNILTVLTVLIGSEEYEVCETAASNMWCSKKLGEWGRGLINTKNDRFRAERTGKLGEMAFAQMFGLAMDIEYKRGGDDKDFKIGIKKINVKTAFRRPIYDAGLVKAKTDAGNIANLDSDIYIFSFIDNDDRDKKEAKVVMVGGITKDAICKYSMSPAKVGKHMNYEIPYDKLLSFKDLGLTL